MFKTRLLSGAVLVLILGTLLTLGGDVLLFALALISLVGLFEWFRILKCEKSALAVVGYIGTILHYVLTRFNLLRTFSMEVQWVFLLTFLLIAMLTIYVFKFPKFEPVHIFGVFFGIIYVTTFLSYVYRIRMMSYGIWLVWLVFIVSWGCDTCAYCTGMLIGKHKMAPELSPKKTIEGAVGGILGTMILSTIYLLVMKNFAEIEMGRIFILVVSAGFAGFVSMIGDLAASAFKRQFEIKDYGTLIPGHGGIMDRFDSVIFVAPIVYYFLVLL